MSSRFMVSRIGLQYDMRNIFDLARYLLPTPPVPTRWRRRMIALRLGRADAHHLLDADRGGFRPRGIPDPAARGARSATGVEGISHFRRQEILHIRHHSLYTPADFDLSPYFEIVKPTLEEGFNYKGQPRPPVEERAVADQVLLLCECDAALSYDLVEVLDGLEVAVDQRLVDERPQMLGGLQLWAMGRLEHELYAVRHDKVLGAMPARIVELQHDALVRPRPPTWRSRRAPARSRPWRHCWRRSTPCNRSRARRSPSHRAIRAMMADRHRPLPDGSPHPACDRLQADAMLVRRPNLIWRADACGARPRRCAGAFLNRARSCSVAA